MIDYEIEIFDAVADAVEAEMGEIVMTSAPLQAPASFPAFNMYEVDNRLDSDRVDSSDIERGAVLSYDVSTYSNRRVGARAEAKKIMGVIDETMSSMNFTRSYMSQGGIPGNESVYRVSARFIAGIDENGKIYRRL